MKLIDRTMTDYLHVLQSDAPAPGGGSVSALAGAQGAALLLMVADLTLGKEKYAEYQQTCGEVKETASGLYAALTEAVDRDTDAFNLVSAAFKMPKDTEERKAARKQAIADATLTATEVPFAVMRLAIEGLQAAERLAGNSNPGAASDLGVAALNFLACVKGAWLNVKINLPGVLNEARAKAIEAEGEQIHADAEARAEALYRRILGSLK